MKFKQFFVFVAINAVLPISLAWPQTADDQPAASDTPGATILYRNLKYGFCFVLPASWTGYTIVQKTWRGTPMNNSEKAQISGPQLLIRNPKWTEDNPYQDIPIMIFTRAQWKLAESDTYIFSAAPFGPGEVGRNHHYVFAQPPRWIGYADAAGMDEVMKWKIGDRLQAPCGKSKAQPAH
ncbi:MAG: hypothetical protein ABSD70_10795 [Terracidiphilus sp.]